MAQQNTDETKDRLPITLADLGLSPTSLTTPVQQALNTTQQTAQQGLSALGDRNQALSGIRSSALAAAQNLTPQSAPDLVSPGIFQSAVPALRQAADFSPASPFRRDQLARTISDLQSEIQSALSSNNAGLTAQGLQGLQNQLQTSLGAFNQFFGPQAEVLRSQQAVRGLEPLLRAAQGVDTQALNRFGAEAAQQSRLGQLVNSLLGTAVQATPDFSSGFANLGRLFSSFATSPASVLLSALGANRQGLADLTSAINAPVKAATDRLTALSKIIPALEFAPDTVQQLATQNILGEAEVFTPPSTILQNNMDALARQLGVNPRNTSAQTDRSASPAASSTPVRPGISGPGVPVLPALQFQQDLARQLSDQLINSVQSRNADGFLQTLRAFSGG